MSFSEYGSAQMPFTNSSSYERRITNIVNPRIIPIKTGNWNDNHIISLVHYGSNKYTNGRFIMQGDGSYRKDTCTASVFYLTEVNTNTVKIVKISGHTVTDFCIVNNQIFMCGQDSADNNFVANESLNTFFDFTNNSFLTIYHLNNIIFPANNTLFDYTLTKIEFCFSTGIPTLLLLANKNNSSNSYFISYNLLNNNFAIYGSNVRLLDIVHTNNYIAVLGMGSNTTFSLSRHDINNISNYFGVKFTTNPLYSHFVDPKYHLATLRKDLNHIVVGESVTNSGWMEFNMIDLTTMQILYTQATIDTREGRSKIMDLEFDEQRNILYCLFCNGLDIRDMILQILPYATQNYSTLLSKPKIYRTGYNLLKDITLYANNLLLLTLGRTPATLDIYLFDRIFNFNSSSTCDEINNMNIGIVGIPNGITFNYALPVNKQAYLQQISLYKDSTIYSVICP